MNQLLGKNPRDGKSRRKTEEEDAGTTHDLTTKCCYSCEEEGHLSRNFPRKREYFPTIVVEYEENEVRDLLALERPKRKKVNGKEMYFKCKELGHYAEKCTERNNKAIGQGSMKKKNLRQITCYKCKQKGHYSDKCLENGAPRLP
jgi:hypothetical protein